MAGFFETVCMCDPPSSVGMGERAGWQMWHCPACRHPWDLEHYYTEDGRYLGCSWILREGGPMAKGEPLAHELHPTPVRLSHAGEPWNSGG
jgi:hypothetical protein